MRCVASISGGVIDELIGEGPQPPVILGDGAYGHATQFRAWLPDRELC